MRIAYSERPVNCPKCGGELKNPQWRMFGAGHRRMAVASAAYARANNLPRVMVEMDEAEAALPDDEWLAWRCDCGFFLATTTKDGEQKGR